MILIHSKVKKWSQFSEYDGKINVSTEMKNSYVKYLFYYEDV